MNKWMTAGMTSALLSITAMTVAVEAKISKGDAPKGLDKVIDATEILVAPKMKDRMLNVVSAEKVEMIRVLIDSAQIV